MSPLRALLACLACQTTICLCACDRDGNQEAAPGRPAPSSTRPAASSEPSKIELQQQAMGTNVHLVAYTTPALDAAAVQAAMRRAFAEIERLERLMSTFRDDSELSEANRRAGQPVELSSDTFSVVEKSLWAGRISGGAFDITFHTLGDLWKFTDLPDGGASLPNPAEVERKRRLIDYRKIELDAATRSVTVPPGRKIDLGGIAKGYAVDRAAAELRRSGVAGFLVQAGGDLYGGGRKPDGSPWVSGIQDPRGPWGSFFAVIELEDQAFSTAGDYARSFVAGKRRYHHILDPKTGYPATACRSVTIWAPDALTADAVDDAVFVMGPDKGIELVETLDGVGAVIVDAKNRLVVSRRLQGKIKLVRHPTDGI